jgi:hypothetical protein
MRTRVKRGALAGGVLQQRQNVRTAVHESSRSRQGLWVEPAWFCS